jgi:hypothetical protein
MAAAKRERLKYPERLPIAGSLTDGFWLNPPEPRRHNGFKAAVLMLVGVLGVVLLSQWLTGLTGLAGLAGLK